MEDIERKKIRKLIYVAVAGALVIIGVSAYFIIRNIQMNATLDLLVAPVSAEVKINGRTYNNGKHKFDPGTINVEITKEGFRAQNYTIDLPSNKTTKLYTYLVQNDGSLDWYINHQEDQMIMTMIGDAKADEEGKKYTEEFPAIQGLPIIYVDYLSGPYTDFRVDGGKFPGCKKDFCIKITDTAGNGYEKALNMIRERGYDPDNYEVIYEYMPVEPLNKD